MTIRNPLSILNFVTLLCLVGIATKAAAQSPELIVAIEKQEIYQGESVLYQVTLNHVENPSAPQLDGLDDFEVAKLGEQSLDSRQITIINGRRSEVVRRGRQYNYRLTPQKSGELTIPAPSARVDGDLLTGREITLNVVPPDNQDSILVEFSTDRSSVYPMQAFELSLTIAVKDLPGEVKDRDPLTVQPDPPVLDVLWLDDDRLPDGLEPEKGWREILEPIISRRGNGFQVNNIGTKSVFSIFGNDATGFHPDPIRTTRKDANGEDAGYWEYRFSRKLIPRQRGTYSFPSISLKGTFADGIDGGRLVGRRIYAMAEGLAVDVKDVPLDGRPDSYIGAVGTFRATAELAPTSVSVGDPMTLTLTLSGQGTLDDARPPILDGHAGIENAFRTYEATEESGPNLRRFTYSLRPLNAEVSEFPSIPVSYFDVDEEKYVTLQTDPVRLTIRDAETLADSEIVSANREASERSSALEVSEGGVFANDSNLTSIRNEAVHPDRWILTWIGMVLAWAAASFGVRRVKRIREDPALLRRRSAFARARAMLDDANSANGDVLRRAVTGLIADFADVPEAGLTPKDAVEHLGSLGADPSLQHRTSDLLNDFDAAQYGAVTDEASMRIEAQGLVEQLIVELKKSTRRGQRPTKVTAATWILCWFMTCGCGASPDL
ncbi:MAG: BatD family protein [Planctomycetota bacterium]